MDNTNTNGAATTRTIKLNEIVNLKDGTSVRIVRIKAGDVWYQSATTKVIEGVPGWMLGCSIVSVNQFSRLVAQ